MVGVLLNDDDILDMTGPSSELRASITAGSSITAARPSSLPPDSSSITNQPNKSLDKTTKKNSTSSSSSKSDPSQPLSLSSAINWTDDDTKPHATIRQTAATVGGPTSAATLLTSSMVNVLTRSYSDDMQRQESSDAAICTGGSSDGVNVITDNINLLVGNNENSDHGRQKLDLQNAKENRLKSLSSSSSPGETTAPRIGAIAISPNPPTSQCPSQPQTSTIMTVNNERNDSVMNASETTPSPNSNLLTTSVTTTSDTVLPTGTDETVTAVAVTREDLEKEVAERILRQAVPAQVISTTTANMMEKINSNQDPDRNGPASASKQRWLLLGMFCLCLVVVIVGAVVGAVVGIKQKQGESNSPLQPSSNNSLNPQQQEILAFLRSNSPDQGLALDNPTSPQHYALTWLLQDLPHHQVLKPASGQDQEFILTRYAMATLYYATNGANWTQNDRWLSADAICSWYGVLTNTACSNTTQRLRRTLEQTQVAVIHLDLSANRLEGSLPDELVFLTSLQNLNLSTNQLEGALPSGWGGFNHSFVSLDLSTNALQGTIRRVGSQESQNFLLLRIQ